MADSPATVIAVSVALAIVLLSVIAFATLRPRGHPTTHDANSAPPVPDDLQKVVSDAALLARVRQIVEERKASPPDPAFERLTRNPLTTATVGFLFTGVVGGLLTYQFQQAQANQRLAGEVREARRLRNVALMDSVNRTLNAGYYAFGRYYDAIAGPDDLSSAARQETLRVRKARLDEFNTRFEARLMADAAMLCAYFGPTANRRFVRLGVKMQYLSWKLREQQKRSSANASTANVDSLGVEIYRLRDSVYSFASGLAASIRDDTLAGMAARQSTERDCAPSLNAGAPYTGVTPD